MGESKRRRDLAAATGGPLEPKSRRVSTLVGNAAADEMRAYMALPAAASGEWPAELRADLDDWCQHVHSRYPNPTIHRDANGRPVIISSGTMNSEKVFVVIDDITGPDDARFRYFGVTR